MSQNSTSTNCSLVSSAAKRTSALTVLPDVIDVDEDSCSEAKNSDRQDDIEVVSPTAELCPVQYNIKLVPSSSAASRSDTAHSRSVRMIIPASTNHFQQLHAGFDILQLIFQYLDICTRLRAAQVCQCWRRMAFQQHLVNSIIVVHTNVSLALLVNCSNDIHLCCLSSTVFISEIL